jgi:hypothetical protein
MKVAARFHPAIGKYHGIVDGGIQFPLCQRTRVCKSIQRRAVYLRRTPQGISVLHPGVIHAVAYASSYNLALFEVYLNNDDTELAVATAEAINPQYLFQSEINRYQARLQEIEQGVL